MFKLALLDLKRKKKSWRLLASVMTLAYAFLAMMLIFFASLDRTEEAEREAIYGSWHVAFINADQDTVERVKNHATVESTGISYTYGMVLGQDEQELGKIGTTDKNTRKMENISLMQGRFPEKDGEVAVELSSLTALGYSAQLNQKISVHVQARRDGKIEEVEETYNLVGIVQDYSAKMKGTTPDKKDYVSFFINSKDKLTVLDKRINFNIRLKKEYIQEYRELVYGSNYKQFIINNYTYLELSEESRYLLGQKELKREIIYIILSCLNGILFFIAVIKHKKEQEEFISLFYNIGSSKMQSNLLIALTGGVNAVFSVFIGNLSAIILSGLIDIFLKIINKNIWILRLPLSQIMNYSIVQIISAVVLCGIGSAYDDNLFAVIKNNRKTKKAPNRVSIKNLLVQKNNYYYFITFILLFMIFNSVCNIYEKKFSYLYVCKSNINDYEFGVLRSYYSLENSMPENIVSQIGKIYGIKDIEAVKSLNYIKAEVESDEYFQKLKKFYWPRYAEQNETCAFVLGFDPKGEAINYYEQQIKFDKNAYSRMFEEGKGVILYLPAYSVNEDGNIEINVGVNSNQSLKVGDQITLMNANGKVKVEICGIISNIKDKGKELNRPFTVLGSYKLCDQLNKGGYHNTVEYLSVTVKDNINVVQTDAEMNAALSKYLFANNRKIKENLLNEYFINSYINYVCGFFCLLAIFVMVNEKFTIDKRQEYKKIKILKQIGISNWSLYKNSVFIELKNIFLIGIFAWLIIFFCKIINYCINIDFGNSTSISVKLGVIWRWILKICPFDKVLMVLISIILVIGMIRILRIKKVIKFLKM